MGPLSARSLFARPASTGAVSSRLLAESRRALRVRCAFAAVLALVAASGLILGAPAGVSAQTPSGTPSETPSATALETPSSGRILLEPYPPASGGPGPVLRLPLLAGTTGRGFIRVVNTSDEELVVKLRTVDAVRGEGSKVFLSGSDHAGQWMSLLQTEFPIQPQSATIVWLTVTLPTDAPAEHLLGGVLATIAGSSEQAEAWLLVDLTPAPGSGLVLSEVHVSPDSGLVPGRGSVTAVLRNLSGVDLTVRLQARCRDWLFGEWTVQEIGPFMLDAGQAREVRFSGRLTNILGGYPRITVVATSDSRSSDATTPRVVFIPWWLVITAAAILIPLIALGIRRRRQRGILRRRLGSARRATDLQSHRTAVLALLGQVAHLEPRLEQIEAQTMRALRRYASGGSAPVLLGTARSLRARARRLAEDLSSTRGPVDRGTIADETAETIAQLDGLGEILEQIRQMAEAYDRDGAARLLEELEAAGVQSPSR